MRISGFTTTRPNMAECVGHIKFCELLEVRNNNQQLSYIK